jgi:phosphoglycolate phosphatase
MKIKFKAVLFDLDGTLLDTLGDLANSMNSVLARLGYPQHPINSYRYFVGDGMRKLAERVLPESDRVSQNIDLCYQGMRVEYAKRWAQTTRPYDGIPQLLAELDKRGIKKVVLSNKPDDMTKLTIEKLLPDFKFDIVQGVSDKIGPKPDPTGACAISKELGLSPSEFLYLGDTNTDMQTAKNVGMYPVGAAWGFRDADELKASGAKAIVQNPIDVISLL